MNKYQKFLTLFVVIFYIWTLATTVDLFNWCLEIFPAAIGAVILFVTRKRFPLTNLSYTLIMIHFMILAYGGRTTYALAPLGEWMKHFFGFARNNYDKIGHFWQGFGPAIWGREVLLRLEIVKNRKWMNFLLVGTILGFAAFYELIEWWVSLATGSAGDAFLGTQGYVWDTQSDMFMALIGGIVALVLLSHYHDKLLKKAPPRGL